MARLYGRLVEMFGFREVREASLAEVEEHVAYLNERAQPRQDEEDGALGGEMTVEQYEALVGSMKANAERYGTKRG